MLCSYSYSLSRRCLQSGRSSSTGLVMWLTPRKGAPPLSWSRFIAISMYSCYYAGSCEGYGGNGIWGAPGLGGGVVPIPPREWGGGGHAASSFAAADHARVECCRGRAARLPFYARGVAASGMLGSPTGAAPSISRRPRCSDGSVGVLCAW